MFDKKQKKKIINYAYILPVNHYNQARQKDKDKRHP